MKSSIPIERETVEGLHCSEIHQNPGYKWKNNGHSHWEPTLAPQILSCCYPAGSGLRAASETSREAAPFGSNRSQVCESVMMTEEREHKECHALNLLLLSFHRTFCFSLHKFLIKGWFWDACGTQKEREREGFGCWVHLWRDGYRVGMPLASLLCEKIQEKSLVYQPSVLDGGAGCAT